MTLPDQFVANILHRSSSAGRPYVTLSFAQSLDGSIAALRGSPLALSGSEAMKLTHKLRAAHQGILVGIGTVLADDPQLTVRLVQGENPRPIVLDSWLRTPPGARLLQGRGSQPWIFTTPFADHKRQNELEKAGARVFRLEREEGDRVSLGELLPTLAKLGIHRLMVEGGAEVITSFLMGQWVDQFVITIAPVLVGGQRFLEQLLVAESHPVLDETSIPTIRFPWLDNVRYEQLGRDLIVWGEWSAADS